VQGTQLAFSSVRTPEPSTALLLALAAMALFLTVRRRRLTGRVSGFERQ
jgi:hypothetical protein